VTVLPSQLPGAQLLSRGLAEIRDGRESEASLLVQIAAPRLRGLGVQVPDHPGTAQGPPEHRLYALLSRQAGGGAHSRYNALLRQAASFARAAEHASPR
jgi:hypothetical protein